eukprot:TRINITY_DN10368_c1_g1_i1.p1 TRINITY_DN10368_c1_g1~~TRINITY_DN10368_c1_g1_i1.p1  ORF type:complete len:187 (+),score=41.97 TRINITY_DN10368_c1_g1_i1:84-644(+)
MVAAYAVFEDGAGKSELLRGIPDFRKMSGTSKVVRSSQGGVAVNPVPAGIQRSGALPRNGHELARELRKYSDDESKLKWLATIPAEAFATIFRVEIDAELLQKMLSTMLAVCSDSDNPEISNRCSEARQIILALASHCPKSLGFAASFAGAKEREKADRLLKLLDSSGDNSKEWRNACNLIMGEDE